MARGRLLTAVLFLACAAARAAEGEGDNLLRNGGFEEGLAPWGANPAFQAATVELVTGDAPEAAHSGRQAVRIRNAGAWSNLYQGTRIPARRTYQLSLWARAGEAVLDGDGKPVTPHVDANIYEYGNRDLSGPTIFLQTVNELRRRPVGREWQEYCVRFTTSDTPYVRDFSLAIGTQGEVILDDVLVREVDTVRESRILYLPFEDSFEAAEAGGGKAPEVRGAPTFVKGKQGRAASFTDNASLLFDADGNFDQAEGTIAMWVLPYWPHSDGAPHCFFEVPGEPERFLDGGFVITKGFSTGIVPNGTYFYNSPGHHHIGGFKFEPNEWVHVAYSWSASQHLMKTYRNGELETVQRRAKFTEAPSSAGRLLVVGARLGGRSAETTDRSEHYGHLPRQLPEGGGWGADAAIDELMIFSRMLTDAEVARVVGIELKPAEKKRPFDATHMSSIEARLETPHIRFARPSATGTVRALFFCVGETPGICATRDMAELAQRFDVECAAVTSGRHWEFGYPKDFYRRWEGLSPAEKQQEAMGRLAEDPDVIGVVNFMFSRLPGPVQNQIGERVRKGAGLVVTRPRALPAAYRSNPDEQGREVILEGVPASVLADAFPDEDLTSDERLRKMVATYRCGEGRVVVLDWYSPEMKDAGRLESIGLTPLPADGRWSRQYEHRYNYHMSLMAKAVQWAAGREPSVRWSKLPPGDWRVPHAELPKRGVPVEITCGVDDARAGIVTTVIRDALGAVQSQAEQRLTVSPGANAFSVELPRCRHGLHFLDLAVSSKAGVENWATVSFRVEGPEHIATLTTDKEYYERGETVRGEVKFQSAIPEPAQLVVRAVDTNGREYNRTTVAVAAGATERSFRITLDRPTTLATHIEAELVRDGQALSYADATVFVPKRDFNDFLSVLWCTIRNEGIGQVALRKVREAGFDAVYHWSYQCGSFENDAMADLMPVQYCTRIVLAPDGRGWSTGFMGNGRLDPKFQEWAKGLGDAVQASMPLGPPYYSLGDENHFKYGIGYSPYEIQAFRQFLAERYGTVDRLNAEYGSQYKSFDEVPRYREGEAVAQGLVPAAVDHRMGVEDEWARYHHRLVSEICRRDPDAKVGAEGSHSGNLERMLEGVRFWGPYGDYVLLRSLASEDVLTSHWWGGYGDGAKDASRLWEWLIRGFANFEQFFATTGIEGILNRDFSWRAFFPTLLPQLQEIHAGPSLLLRDAEVISDDPVAVHYSALCDHASLAFRALTTASGSRGNMAQAFGDLGVDYRYVSSRQMIAGQLGVPKAEVLLLPMSMAMSEEAADSIAAFVSAGGTVVAEFLPGVLNEYGRRLDEGRLDEVFGATCAGGIEPRPVRDLGIGVDLGRAQLKLACSRTMTDAALTVTTATTLAQVDGVPVLLSNRHGRGRAILLNFDAARAGKRQQAQFLASLLQATGVKPLFRLAEPSGAQASVKQRGRLTLVGVLLPGDSEAGNELSWDEPAHVYDVREGEYLGRTNTVRLSAAKPPKHIHLLALQDERIGEIELDCTASIDRGQTLTVTVRLLDAEASVLAAQDRVLRLDVSDPGGRAVRHYRQFLRLTAPRGTMSVPFAFNDAPGRWPLTVTDVATGVSATRTVALSE